MAEKVPVHQALYGYSDGHRLLAASIALEPEVQRVLRTISDAAFDDKTDDYLTIFPLPAQRLHAFVKTWPASDAIRPGSVWSHVLLVDSADIARLEGMAGLWRAFKRPQTRDAEPGAADLREYQTRIRVDADIGVDSPVASDAVLEEVLAGLYLSGSQVRVQVPEVRHADSVLLAVFEQQWPRLRRTFAGRTRGRASQSKDFDLELVENRIRTNSQGGPGKPSAEWMSFAIADLKSADHSFRSFLQLAGAESMRGRQDYSAVAEVFSAGSTVHGSMRAASLIRERFPTPDGQRAMKRLLFGEARPGPIPADWPTSDIERLRLAFAASPALDFGDLEIGRRLVQSFDNDTFAGVVLSEVELDELSVENVEDLVLDVVDHAATSTATELALSQPDLGLLIVSKKVGLLADLRIWEGLDNDLLIDFLTQNDLVRHDVSDALVADGSVEPLARICAAIPSEWWRLLHEAAPTDGPLRVEWCRTLHAVLTRIGTAALDSPPERIQTPRELAALALAADLSSGLWRRVKTADWIDAMRCVDPRNAESTRDLTSRQVVDRIFAVALVSAANGGSPTNRKTAWMVGYGYLHEALASKNFDEEAWSLLGTSLPAGPDWDRCQRLRRGAAAEVRRDQWAPDRVRDLIEASHPYEHDLVDLITYRAKKKDSLVRGLLKLLR